MIISSDKEMQTLGAQIGAELRGGEIFELIGDIGVGKTTFAKGLARGLGVKDDVQSPSFTINRNYQGRDGLILNHYDFYRLTDAGIMLQEIAESLTQPHNVIIVEWGASVHDILSDERVVVKINYRAKEGREVTLQIPKKLRHLVQWAA